MVSFILQNERFDLKELICSNNNIIKTKVTPDVKMTINSAIAYTKMPMDQVHELIGYIFSDDISEFGIY